ncbi:hypothetical protein L249_5612, partial [Ophiocordyceps polyrhachis-furcata BCC 54312]
TRPEGLGGSRDAGPAAAGPRPPRRLRHGYAVQRLRPYGPYGPYEGRNVGVDAAARHNGRTRPEGLGGSRDVGPATAGPRPPYVIEARRLRHGYAVQRLL